MYLAVSAIETVRTGFAAPLLSTHRLHTTQAAVCRSATCDDGGSLVLADWYEMD